MRWTYYIILIPLILSLDTLSQPIPVDALNLKRGQVRKQSPTTEPDGSSPRKKRKVTLQAQANPEVEATNARNPPKHEELIPVKGKKARKERTRRKMQLQKKKNLTSAELDQLTQKFKSDSKPKQPSKRKNQSVKSFDEFIRTKYLRGSSYRKDALKKENDPTKDSPSYQADHIIELQAVTAHMNKFRLKSKPTDIAQCFQELKAHVNSVKNLKMIPASVNNKKGWATTEFLRGKPNPAGFSNAEVYNHILNAEHKANLKDTARELDKTLQKDICGKMPPGMQEHLNQMRKIALDAKKGK